MIQLTVSFDTKEELLEFLGGHTISDAAVVETTTGTDAGNNLKQSEESTAEPQDSGDDEKAALLEKAREMGIKVRANASVETIKQRIADAETPAASPQSDPTPAKEKDENAVTPSKDDVRAALGKLNESKGLEVAMAVLKQFDAQRISDLAENQYAEFIKACEAGA